MKTKKILNAFVAMVALILANFAHAYMGGFEAQDGYLPLINNVNGYNAGQYGTNNGGPGGASAAIPLNTGLWSRLDPIAPGFSYVTGHQSTDRTWVNTAGGSGSSSDLGLVITTNHQGWNAGPLHYRYDLDNRDYNGTPVASSANSVVNVSFWWCANMDQNVGNGYFGDEISFYDGANKLAFRLGLTERNTGDKVTYWNGATMFESTIVGASSRYDRWDLSFNYVAKTVTASYFQFSTSTLIPLCTNVPMMDVLANGLTHWEIRSTPGVNNAKLMSIDDVEMEVVGDPDDCMDISNGVITCVPKPTGGYTYTYNFTLTNLSGQFVHTALIPAVATVPANGSVTLSPNVIPVNLPPGGFVNTSVAINGANPGQEVCFRITLFNFLIGECCSEVVCLKMPCVKFTQSQVTCTPGVIGSVNWNASITNTSGGPIKWVEFIPKTPGVQIVPGQVDLGSLANNATAVLPTLQFLGAPPNSQVCFYVVVMNSQFDLCCIQEHCITVPDCGVSPVPLPPLPTGIAAEPCKPDHPGGVVAPDGCLTICDEKLICDTSDPLATVPCVLYTFTVTNTSTFPISNLVFPVADVTPSQVFFNPPLNPGQAATVTVKICNQPPGPFVFPIVALDLEKCQCCSIIRDLVLPNCDCLQVLESMIKCVGQDSSGNYCYQWDATIQNLEPWIANHAFLLPSVPANATFTPQYFNIPPISQFGTTTLSSVIKVPGNPSSVTFYITIHDDNMVNCCAIPFTIQLPSCCDCDKMLTFGTNGSPDGSVLPAGVSLLNLEMSPQGKIGFPSTTKPLPYVYMAASGRGTIVRIDANTGVVLGEYRTVPQSRGGSHNPSRTTVDRFGECWVGNRNDAFNVGNTVTGSVMRIGLVIGGIRGNKVPKVGGGWTVTPSATGEYLEGPFTYLSPSVVDRDSDGLIRTSSGLGNILDWDSALAGTNNAGGVSLAADECIVTFTRTKAVGVRALAIDANNDLWVGGFPGQNVYGRISGATGVADVSTVGVNPGIRNIGGGYGALIDSNNVLWSVSREGTSSSWGVYRHVIATNTTTFISAEGNYGIGVDLCTNTIWVSSVYKSNETRAGFNLANQYVLRRFNAAGTLTGAYAQPDPGNGIGAQGLSVDGNGHPFVSKAYTSPGEVWHFDQNGTLLATITGTNGGSTGTAVDHNGKIWVSDYNGNQALRINPTTNTQELAVPLGAGATPYNYSDMTGYVALNAAGQFGMLQYMQDSKCPDTDWGKVSWTTLGETLSCTIRVEVRASNNPLSFPTLWTPVRSGENFCGRGVKGQYIQVRVIFRRPAGCPPECNPQLCTLRIQCCDKTQPGSSGGSPPVVSVPGVIYVAFGGLLDLTAFASDPDGDDMTATLSSGGYVEYHPVFAGTVHFEAPLDPGQGTASEQAFQLAVSDGENVTTKDILVVRGNQAPTITAPAARSIKAFSVPMPDFRPEAVVYDDLTPPGDMPIVQTPAPGTPMPQGGHTVILSVTDAGGKVGMSETYLEVAPIVSVGGIVNYQAIPYGNSFSPVPIVDEAMVTQVGLTQLVIDDVVFRTSGGVMTAAPVTLPPGQHKIAFRVFSNTLPLSSASRPLVVFVMSEGGGTTGTVAGPLPLLSIMPAAPGQPNDYTLDFTLDIGTTYCLMKSENLRDWELMQTILGTGAAMQIPVTVTPGTPRQFFRLERP